MRTSIWLVRHGQTTLNKARRYQGTTESALTEFGQGQALALAWRLRRTPFDTVLASPTQRTQATAAAIVAERDLPVLVAPAWAETNHGRWEGLTYREVRERFPAEASARFADPLHGRPQGGESLAEVNSRVLLAWNELVQRFANRRLLVATHATPIQLVLCALAGTPPEQHWRWRIDLGSLTAIDVYGTTPIIRHVNEVPPFRQG